MSRLPKLLFEYLPAVLTLVSAGLLLNPFITWPQVAALFLVYALYMGHQVVALIRSGREVSTLKRMETLEEEVRQLVQAQSFENLNG